MRGEPDWQRPRFEEALRRMRGARTEEDLLDVASWINLRKDLFTEESLQQLRSHFARTRAQVVNEHEAATTS